MPASPHDLDQIRSILEEITSKWTLLLLNTLCHGPARFNALRRAHPDVTQKALTQCLRRLEAIGIIQRTVLSTSPVAVVYEVSPLGASLEPHMKGLLHWSIKHREEITEARAAYVARRVG